MSEEQGPDTRTSHLEEGSSRAPDYASTLSRIADVIAPLSIALDLGSGAAIGHSLRTCIVGMRLAAELRVPAKQQSGLFYGLLLKDSGFTINVVDEGNRDIVAIRCERGAALSRFMGLPEESAIGIRSICDRWNGQGNPHELSNDQIPIASRIILAAQTLDTLGSAFGAEAALRVLSANSGGWFDPDVVKAAYSLNNRSELEVPPGDAEALPMALGLEPDPLTFKNSSVTFDTIFQTFAAIVDAKSSFRYLHSHAVADVAAILGEKLGLAPARIRFLRHAALLHDIGKLAVPNEILLKSYELTAEEWQAIRVHPEFTLNLIRRIPDCEELSEVAAAHHERLDGSGYPRGLIGDQIPLEARILAVADVFDALQSKRPYRAGMPREVVIHSIRMKTPGQFDPDCVKALETADLSSVRSAIDSETQQAQRSAAAGRKNS